MATTPQIPAATNDIPLSGPPPNGVNSPAQQGGTSQFGGIAGTPGPAPDKDTTPKFLLQVGAAIDQGIKAMAQAAPDLGDAVNQANQIIQSAIAKYLSQSGSGAVAQSPTSVGPNFTGTGGV